MNKIDKAILAELNQWDLSCSEEPELKIELAKALGRVVKNFSTSDVVERSKQCCEPVGEGFYLGTSCPKCKKPFRQNLK